MSAAAEACPNGGAKTEVIEHGGVGDFHGNFAATFQNQRLNARNPFASNKPPCTTRGRFMAMSVDRSFETGLH